MFTATDAVLLRDTIDHVTMTMGPLAKKGIALRDRIRTISADRRNELAYTWARRALHAHLTPSLSRPLQPRASRFAGWLGPINTRDDVEHALSAVSSMLAELGPYEYSEERNRTPEELDRLRLRVSLNWAQAILTSLSGDLDAEALRVLSYAALMLANKAGCYEEELRQMLEEAGGVADA